MKMPASVCWTESLSSFYVQLAADCDVLRALDQCMNHVYSHVDSQTHTQAQVCPLPPHHIALVHSDTHDLMYRYSRVFSTYYTLRLLEHNTRVQNTISISLRLLGVGVGVGVQAGERELQWPPPPPPLPAHASAVRGTLCAVRYNDSWYRARIDRLEVLFSPAVKHSTSTNTNTYTRAQHSTATLDLHTHTLYSVV